MTTSLLLPFDSDLTDRGSSPKEITAFNGASVTTSLSKFGGGSLDLTGASSYVSSAPDDDFAFGVGDFTVEAWIYLPSIPTGNFATIVETRESASGGVLFVVDASLRLGYYFDGSEIRSPSSSLSLNQWIHVALCRSSGTSRLFVNGVNSAGQIDAGGKSGRNCFIGRNWDNYFPKFSGYIDDLRITKGVAHYTSDFTPPSSHLPDAEGTCLIPALIAGSCLSGGIAQSMLLPAFSVESYSDVVRGGASLEIPPITGVGNAGAFSSSGVPALQVFALGSPSVLNSLSASFPQVHAIGRGGAVAKLGLPAVSIMAAGTVSNIGRTVGGRLPPVQITATALVGAAGRVAGGRLPAITGGGVAGGGTTTSPVAFPAFAGGGTGTMGTAGRVVGGVLPAIAGYATARRENYGRIEGGTLPAFTMPSRIIGRATLLPISGRAVATAGVGHAWTLEWALLAIEAYVMGVDVTGEAASRPVTRYTNYPFLQIIRLGDSYYGVAPDGLHRIGGTQDNGAPIPWAMQTHVTDFGSQRHKTVASAYLGGMIGPSVTFSVLTGEHPEQMHTHTNTFTTQLKNHREKFGKGRKARYWAFGLSSATATSGLMLDALDLEVFEMSRRVI